MVSIYLQVNLKQTFCLPTQNKITFHRSLNKQLLLPYTARTDFYNRDGMYEGWNFNFGNAALTFDTAHLQSSYFRRPSMYSPKLCRTRSQR